MLLDIFLWDSIILIILKMVFTVLQKILIDCFWRLQDFVD